MFIEELNNDQYKELGEILIDVESKLNKYEFGSIIDVGGEISIHQPWVLRVYGLYKTISGKAVFVDFEIEDYFCTIYYPAEQKVLINEPSTTNAIRKYFKNLFKQEYKNELKRELAELENKI